LLHLLVFHAYIKEMQVKEAKSPVKNLVRQRFADGFNSGVKTLNTTWQYILSCHSGGQGMLLNILDSDKRYIVPVCIFTTCAEEYNSTYFK
jgi:hypothetical protein